MIIVKPVLALIGGIGAGKTAAAAALAKRGGRVVAADPVGHAALLDPANRDRIADRWPVAVAADGSIDRQALGRIVFSDPAALTELEAIVFPWIAEQLTTEIAAAKADPAVRFVVLDAAVLLEANMQGLCDRIVFVDSPHDIRLARVGERGWSPDELDRRERSQWSLDRKKRAATAVLVNDGSPAVLQANADALLASWGLIPHG